MRKPFEMRGESGVTEEQEGEGKRENAVRYPDRRSNEFVIFSFVSREFFSG